jgi:hypothetical protein
MITHHWFHLLQIKVVLPTLGPYSNKMAANT